MAMDFLQSNDVVCPTLDSELLEARGVLSLQLNEKPQLRLFGGVSEESNSDKVAQVSWCPPRVYTILFILTIYSYL